MGDGIVADEFADRVAMAVKGLSASPARLAAVSASTVHHGVSGVAGDGTVLIKGPGARLVGVVAADAGKEKPRHFDGV